MNKSYKPIAATTKACEILKYLGNQPQPVPATAIAEATKLPLGTTMCHLETLERYGFVQIIGDKYFCGTGLALIWSRVKSNLKAQQERIKRDLAAMGA